MTLYLVVFLHVSILSCPTANNTWLIKEDKGGGRRGMSCALHIPWQFTAQQPARQWNPFSFTSLLPMNVTSTWTNVKVETVLFSCTYIEFIVALHIFVESVDSSKMQKESKRKCRMKTLKEAFKEAAKGAVSLQINLKKQGTFIHYTFKLNSYDLCYIFTESVQNRNF